MCPPYIQVEWCDCAFRPDEQAWICKPHETRQQHKPVEEILWNLVIGQQFSVLQKNFPVVTDIAGIRFKTGALDSIDERSDAHRLGTTWMVAFPSQAADGYLHIGVPGLEVI